jgi:hypothetical protein
VSAGAESEPTDVRAVAEAVADVLAERGLVVPAARVSTPRVLDARQVGLLLGRDRQWVYDHAAELGGFRYGDGPRARLGFDLAVLERWKRGRQMNQTEAGPSASRRGPRRRVLASAKLIPYEPSGSGSSDKAPRGNMDNRGRGRRPREET